MQYPLVKIGGVDDREALLGQGVGPGPEASGQGNQLAELFNILLRRWLAIIPTALLIFAVLFSVSMSASPVFSATARLLVNPARDQVVGISVEDAAPDFSPVESEMEMLGSPALLRSLVDKLDLAKDPEFNADLRPERGLSGLLPWLPAPAAAPPQKSSEAVRNAVANGVGSAIALRRRGSNGIDITVESLSPERAALIANTLVDLHYRNQLEARLSSLERASGWLTERLDTLRTELRDKELAAENHRIRHGLSAASGGEETRSAQSTDVQGLLVGASADLAEREARLRQVEAMIQEGRPADTIGGVLNSTVVSDLRVKEADLKRREAELSQRYTDQHPTMLALRSEIEIVDRGIKDEVGRIATNMRNEVEVARARLAELRASFGDIAGDRAVDNAAVVKYRELLRDAAAARSVYEGFLARSHDIAQQGSLPTGSTQLIAAAEAPTGPIRPNRNFSLLMALCLAGIGGLAAGFLVHLLDRSIASVSEVESKLREPAIASVPRLKRSDYARLRQRKRTPADYLVEKPLSAFAEAVRVLRTALQRRGPNGRIRVVAVTSAIPNEGKTTMSLCLARAVALAGQKVAVIDCDLRRSSILNAVALKAETGLIEVLTGDRVWQDLMVSDPSTKVDILPCGKSRQPSDDIFASESMRRLISELRDAYDLVVLDCAPVLALAETRVVVAHADAAVVVMRSQKTSVNLVRTALRVVRSTGTEPLGIVLNRVNQTLLGRSTDGEPLHYASSKPYYVS